MGAREAIAGLGALQDAFEKGATRKFDLDQLLRQQAFSHGERIGTEGFQAGESDKNRANAIRQTQISSGPAYINATTARDQATRAATAEKTAADTLAASPEGQTTVGAVASDLVRGGAVQGGQLLANMSGWTSEQKIAWLNSKAFSEPDPTKAAKLRAASNDMLETYNAMSESEAYYKGLGQVRAVGDRYMDYNYDPAPVMPAVTSILKQKLPGYDSSAPLFEYYAKMAKKDPSFSREGVRESLINDLASKILESDPKLDALRAKQAAGAIWMQIEIGGVGNLMEPEAYDDSGSPKGSKFKYRPIGIRIDKSSFFGSPAMPHKSIDQAGQPPPKSGASADEIRNFYRTGSKTPTADAAKE